MFVTPAPTAAQAYGEALTSKVMVSGDGGPWKVIRLDEVSRVESQDGISALTVRGKSPACPGHTCAQGRGRVSTERDGGCLEIKR